MKRILSILIISVLVIQTTFPIANVYALVVPENPKVVEVTRNSIELEAIEGYEYSNGGIIWQDSNIFKELSPGHTYEIYQRIKDAAEYNCSEVLEVTTKKNENWLTARRPKCVEVGADYVVLDSNGCGGTEFSKDGINFQSSSTFTDLKPNTTYEFCQRFKEEDFTYASENSPSVSVTTLKYENLTEPIEITVLNVGVDKIEILEHEGYEYGMTYGERDRPEDVHTDAKWNQSGPNYYWDWSSYATFPRLLPGHTYRFYQRIRATNDTYASKTSSVLVTTLKYEQEYDPETPVVESFTDTSIVLESFGSIYEYSIDGINFQDSNIFSDLKQDTEYEVCQRVRELDDKYASKISEKVKVKTLKTNNTIPLLPKVIKVTEDSIELKSIEGYEYSIDGVNFQKYNLFTHLKPYTKYKLYQRIKTTETTYMSAISEPISVLTVTKDKKITFDANGGICTITSIDTDAKIEKLPEATKTGFVFLGWYTLKTGGEQITTNTIFENSTTVYAQWKKIATVIPEPEHTYSSEWKTDETNHWKECTVCALQKDKAAHTAGKTTIENKVSAKCTVAGSYDEVTRCTVCNKELSRIHKNEPAKGHTAKKPVRENVVAATCTQKGSYNEVTYCKDCNKKLITEKKEIAATEHTKGEPVKENIVKATAKKEGSYDEVIYCIKCNKELSREKKTTPMQPSNSSTNTTTKPSTDITITTKYKLGDVNNDGRINTKDAREVLLTYIGKKTMTSEQKLAADVNKDGKINTKDARQILLYYIGKIKNFKQ